MGWYARVVMFVGVVSLAATGIAGCGGGGGKDVKVVLSEFIVQPDPTSIKAGTIKFTADNQGGKTHEMVVVKADDAESLATDKDGAVDEEGLAKGQSQGEVEDVAKGTTKSVELKLAAGRYVVFCNLVEDESGTAVSHFDKGMHAVLTVE
jgi:uncharacterized cupredoxin-like copper-binding protein